MGRICRAAILFGAVAFLPLVAVCPPAFADDVAFAADAASAAPPSAAPRKSYMHGGFEMQIFFDTLTGYQRFSRLPTTEVAYDGSPGGVLGEYLPQPPMSQGVFGFYVPKVELDIVKRIGEIARMRADISFGRPNSGSYIGFMSLNHAYAAVKISQEYNVEFMIGRFGAQAGYEPFRAYHNDTVSWSILWRANLYPPGMTGAQISADLTDTMSVFFAINNGNINDNSTIRETLPSFYATLEWTWGPEVRPNQFVLTPYFGPESGGNRPFTYGADATLVLWPTERLKLGLEACYQRDNEVLDIAVPAAENTDYYAGIVNFRMDLSPQWYGVLKYAISRQVGAGNGVLNLTGMQQTIHEASIGVGYQLNDSAKFKGEFRFDVVDPDGARAQTVPGAAFEYTWFF